ncbi:Zn-ribbon domain-containing OB-fold protein [Haloarcula onubensis]|uniref:OB-fold domain-containing protein n=1 Tax=Haloarcula onubensis TaxID=2950539 RepID=A0ABU2FMU1_9EURY|nr:OB-fold domain-containing protein [Halomicroarcula sp. S3CR25-11]MDS0281612.1 OB-fold domain-containing protein [Halomicroarcula sp. S3CR25-11]
MTETPLNGEYDDWLDGIEAGEPYYVECSEGHGWLPPRRVCPDCGSRDLHEEPLPDSGEIATHTTITVATPQFEDDAPYVTAIADFGPVSITGLVRGVDPKDVSMGDAVGLEVGERETTGERAVVFRPR